MKKIILLIIPSIMMVSCASVKFYKDENLKNKTGIRFYSPKPYLLVERESVKDVALKATIIYLPDKSSPQFAKITSGMGSSDLKLTLENGIITSYGILTDSKIPESITALTGILTATGSAYKSLAEAKNILKGKEEKTVEQSANIEDMQKAEKKLVGIVKGLEFDSTSNFITKNQKDNIKELIVGLKRQEAELKKYILKDIPKIVEELSVLIPKFKEILISSDSQEAKNYNTKINQYKKELLDANDILIPPQKTSVSSFELYEIIIEQNNTKLKKAEITNEL